MTNILFLDLETCGLTPPAEGSGIVEFAWRLTDMELNDLGSWVGQFHPECDIHPEATKTHGYTLDDLKSCPTFSWPDGVKADILCGHNIPFDLKFLKPYIPFTYHVVDTLPLARRYVKDTANHKLGTLAERFNIDKGTAHRADSDVLVCKHLLANLCELSGRTVEDFANTPRAMIHAMPFGKHKGTLLTQLPYGYVKWLLSEDIDSELRKSLESLSL